MKPTMNFPVTNTDNKFINNCKSVTSNLFSTFQNLFSHLKKGKEMGNEIYKCGEILYNIYSDGDSKVDKSLLMMMKYPHREKS